MGSKVMSSIDERTTNNRFYSGNLLNPLQECHNFQLVAQVALVVVENGILKNKKKSFLCLLVFLSSTLNRKTNACTNKQRSLSRIAPNVISDRNLGMKALPNR